ncbi:UNVERIFIED_CONTAM: hypothetical protein Cloal_1087 [Acetivibrio alkalicellulosi]
MNSNEFLSKYSENMSAIDLLLSTFNVTTFGIVGYISFIMNEEAQFIVDAQSSLRKIYIEAWAASNLSWGNFNQEYTLEITYITYEERVVSTGAVNMMYIYSQTSTGRDLRSISNDEEFKYNWVSRRKTIARFVSLDGDYLQDSNGNYIGTELFERGSFRREIPGKDFLEKDKK